MSKRNVVCPLADALGKMLIMSAGGVRHIVGKAIGKARKAQETADGAAQKAQEAKDDLDRKLDKVTGTGLLTAYVKKPDGTQGTVIASNEVVITVYPKGVPPPPETVFDGSIPLRKPNGHLLVPEMPSAADHAASKGYVDGKAQEVLAVAQGKASPQDVADAELRLLAAISKKADTPVKEIVNAGGDETYTFHDGVITKAREGIETWSLVRSGIKLELQPPNMTLPTLPWTQQSISAWSSQVGGSGVWLRFGVLGQQQISMTVNWQSGQLWLSFGGEDGSHGGLPLGQQFNGGVLQLEYANDFGLQTDGTLAITPAVKGLEQYPLLTQAQQDALATKEYVDGKAQDKPPAAGAPPIGGRMFGVKWTDSIPYPDQIPLKGSMLAPVDVWEWDALVLAPLLGTVKGIRFHVWGNDNALDELRNFLQRAWNRAIIPYSEVVRLIHSQGWTDFQMSYFTNSHTHFEGTDFTLTPLSPSGTQHRYFDLEFPSPRDIPSGFMFMAGDLNGTPMTEYGVQTVWAELF